jgi:hypothetical protein
LKNCWGNTYVVYPYGGGSLEIRRQTQTTKGSSNETVPSGNYDLAYINHGIAPSNVGYRYITILGGDTTKTNLLAGTSTPIEIVQQDNNAHIVRQNQLKITAYSVFATNALLTNGIVESSVRPFVGMIQENTDGTVDLALSDPDLNRPSGGMTSNVKLNIVLRGNYELVEGNTGLTYTNAAGKFSISQTCKNGATYKIKLKNLDILAVEKKKINNLSVYPNPIKDQLIITASNKNYPFNLNLYDINGQQLMNATMTSDIYTFNTSSLPVGMYLLKVEDRESSEVFKVIKE